MGSLQGKFGKTVAVVANGLANSDMYPKQNLQLANQIVDNGGAIVSEHIVGTKAKQYYFPIRNRIVSGLANKILVVEAAEKSGTLITVRSCSIPRKRCVCSATDYLLTKPRKVLIY